jgi:hypothetical protein
MWEEWLKRVEYAGSLNFKKKPEDEFETLGLKKFVENKKMEFKYLKPVWSKTSTANKVNILLVSSGFVIVAGVLIYTEASIYADAISLEVDLASSNQRLSILDRSLDLEQDKTTIKYHNLIEKRQSLRDRINLLLEKKSESSNIVSSSLNNYKKK